MNDSAQQLPPSWLAVTLSCVAEINPKVDKTKIPDDLEVSFVPMPAVEELTGRIDLGTSRRFSEVKNGYTPFQQGDVLFAKITPCMENGKMAVVPALKNGCGFGSTEFHVLRPSPSIDAKYLYYLVSSQHFRNGAEHNMTGAVGQRRVPTLYLSEHNIPLAPIAEQRRIVARIEELFSELDKGVEALKAARDQLKAYRHSVLKHAFDGRLSERWRVNRKSSSAERRHDDEISSDELANFPKLPISWSYVRLGRFIDHMDAGKSFKCDERIPGPQEIGVAKVSAVTWGEYDEDESKTCTDPEMVNPHYFIKQGDFLFSRANTIELVGACVISKNVRRRVMLSDKTLRLVFRGVPTYYVLYYLRSHLGRREITSRSTGNQESMRNIGQDRIRSIILPMCSREEAEYIESQIQVIHSSIDQAEATIETELRKSNALRQSILKLAFAGQLVAQDPTDEPACALLERIRAEHGHAPAQKIWVSNGRKKVAL